MMAVIYDKRRLGQAFFLATSIASLIACPYSKVEESFNLQATHDVFYHGLMPALRSFVTVTSTININSSSNNDEGDSSGTIPVTPHKQQLPYDHLQYPGVVPRTFAGPLVLGGVACQLVRIALYPVCDVAEHPAAVQFLARLLLLLLTARQWFGMADALDHQRTHKSSNSNSNSHHDISPGTYLLVITACQFHLPFYMSRMLPNSFACIFTIRSYTHWLRGGDFEMMAAAVDMVIATVLFRCDCLLLLFTVGLSWLMTRQLSVVRAVKIGLATAAVVLTLTVPLDSLLWQRLVWAEGEVFFYNTILNKSSDWGVSAWHWYWSTALPKSLLLTILLIPLSVFRLPEVLAVWERRLLQRSGGGGKIVASRLSWIDTTWLPFLLPALGFVALYSALGHKEVRFLLPALPLFNLAAAVGMSRLHAAAFPSKDKAAAFTSRFGYAVAILALGASYAASCVFVAISRWNYPGGDALHMLAQRVGSDGVTRPPVRVHVDVASAMTGINLFGQRAAQAHTPRVFWTFDKAGYEDENAFSDSIDWRRYTHLLTETTELANSEDSDFEVVGVAQGNPRLDFRRGTISTSDAIFVLERKGWASRLD